MEQSREFERRAERFQKAERALDKQFRRVSNMRLAVFLLGLAAAILGYSYCNALWGSLALVVTVGLFAVLVVRHQHIAGERDRYAALAAINQQNIRRITGEGWDGFLLTGEEFSDGQHPYSDDLNLFGHASLFQWLNTTHSWHGRGYLRNLLADPDRSLAAIRRRQEAVKELARELEFCQELQALGLNAQQVHDDPEKLFAICEQERGFFRYPWLRLMIIALPIFTITVWVGWFYNRAAEYLLLGCGLLLLHMLINLVGFSKVSERLSVVGDFRERIRHYQRFFELLEPKSFVAPLLIELRHQLLDQKVLASQAIRRLDSLSGLIEMRSNPIVHFVVNVVLFWDFHCVFSLDRWRQANGARVRPWVETLGRIEALSSLAMVAQINPHWAWPEFSDIPVQFEAMGLGHPLLPAERCVVNNVELNDKILVITGSNMAGKTTLLRTVGANLVLAYAGAPVCAVSLRCSVMNLHTSMRIQDDLHSGISTFYAELLRIRSILDDSRRQQPLLFLIDEVFRGTNSEDRALGAKSVVLNLNRPWVVGLIATHDLEICELADSHARIRNYHFMETYEKGEIRFDYRLHTGRSQTRNAQFLMKMVGIEMASGETAQAPGTGEAENAVKN
ncbi:MAG: DNA mismatch repair protein MutS [Syntrophomonadaceae bacterium]|nr:DNA mismatch repair protein MutS [Syntrophomonadaceae bacterium]